MKARDTKGYPFFFLDPTNSWMVSLLVTLLISAVAIGVYVWYSYTSSDPTPDSILGYSLAILGTTFAIMASIRYTLYRHSRARGVGRLNVSLNWHISFGFIALVLLFLHSFGNFNPRSGTYALYAMLALVLSGIIGRIFDRVIPRMIAVEARKALTAQGEDRIESISRTLQSIAAYNSQEVRAFNAKDPRSFAGIPMNLMKNSKGKQAGTLSSNSNGRKGPSSSAGASALQSSWDLAYISLEETPQEVNRDSAQYRFVPDRKSTLARPGALIPGAQEHILALRDVQQALNREQFLRAIPRYWRMVHILLVVLTIGLTMWHLEYAATLLIPVFFH